MELTLKQKDAANWAYYMGFQDGVGRVTASLPRSLSWETEEEICDRIMEVLDIEETRMRELYPEVDF